MWSELPIKIDLYMIASFDGDETLTTIDVSVGGSIALAAAAEPEGLAA